MAIKITENGVVRYENDPNVDRLLFPNIPEGGGSPEQITQAVNTWLEDHPEATTTVMDGSISRVKLDSELNSYIEDITNIGSPPKVVETEENTADLYFADSDGNVFAEFVNGHIRTKKFDSSQILDKVLTNSSAAFSIVDDNGNVVVEFAGGHIKTKNFDSQAVIQSSDNLSDSLVEYWISDGNLYLSFGYTDQNDAVIVMNNGRANGLFDFSALMLKVKGTHLNTAALINAWTSGSDMHSPFQFLAKQNADGYYADATSPGYSGGNHTQTINGTVVKTASSRYVRFYADGRPVISGYGRCRNFEIKWANNIQAYNCIKADGTGRTSMIEYHDMIFDGVKFDETVAIVPQEDIKMSFWEAFATVSWGATYQNIRFIDGVNRGKYPYISGTNYQSGNNLASGMILWGDDHALEMHMDNFLDLGKRTYYTGEGGAHTSAQKAYFQVIRQNVDMAEDEAYYVHGSFRFFPAEEV